MALPADGRRMTPSEPRLSCGWSTHNLERTADGPRMVGTRLRANRSWLAMVGIDIRRGSFRLGRSVSRAERNGIWSGCCDVERRTTPATSAMGVHPPRTTKCHVGRQRTAVDATRNAPNLERAYHEDVRGCLRAARRAAAGNPRVGSCRALRSPRVSAKLSSDRQTYSGTCLVCPMRHARRPCI